MYHDTMHRCLSPHQPVRRAKTGLVIVALVIVLAMLLACGSGGDGEQAAGPGTELDSDDAASSGSSTNGDDGTSGADTDVSNEDSEDSGDSSEDGASEAGSGTDLESESSDASTDLERRVSETLSDLDAEQRGGDTVVTLPEQVLFDFDQDVLRTDAAETLDGMVEVITYFADAPIQVNGHTDSHGSDAYNQDLSQRRAQAVVDYLVGGGVDGGRLTAQGFGETRPVAPNTNPDGSDDPEGRALNRRVEIVIEGVSLDDLPS